MPYPRAAGVVGAAYDMRWGAGELAIQVRQRRVRQLGRQPRK